MLGYTPLAFVARETITDVSSSVGLTSTNIPTIQPRTSLAIVQAIDGDIRFTVDGVTAPVAATTGKRLLQDDYLELWTDSLEKIRFIDDGGTAQLEVDYFGRGS